MATSNKTITETIKPSSDQIEAISARGYQVGSTFLFFVLNRNS